MAVSEESFSRVFRGGVTGGWMWSKAYPTGDWFIPWDTNDEKVVGFNVATGYLLGQPDLLRLFCAMILDSIPAIRERVAIIPPVAFPAA